MFGHRTDGEMAIGLADVAQVADATDVDEHGRRCKPELHHRDKGVAPGEELGLVAVFTQKRDRLFGRLGDFVIKRCRNHDSPATLNTALTMLW